MSATVAACSSSSSSDADANSNNNEVVKELQRPTVRRKRVAASRLPPLAFLGYESQSSTVSSNSTSSSLQGSPQELERGREGEEEEENSDAKRKRVSTGGLDASSSVGDQSRSPSSSCDLVSGLKGNRHYPDILGKTLFGYEFFGAGKDFYGTSVKTGVHKVCQVIKTAQYEHLLKVRERLNDAEKYWPYENLDEMKEFVLPTEVEVFDCGHGYYVLLTPWPYGNPDISSFQSIDKENFVRPIFTRIVEGVEFCHALGIMVRDLKPRKFVFADEDKTTLRLHDIFGLYVCDEVDNDLMTDHHGVPAYVAPEVLRRAPVEYAGKAADIWALGVLFYYLLLGKHPFNDTSLQRVFTRICRVQYCIPPCCYVTQAARIMINGIFKKEPADRPTAQQLLHLRWFSESSDTSPILSPTARFAMHFQTGSGSQQTLLPSSRSSGSSRRRSHRGRTEDDAQVVPSSGPEPQRRAENTLELNILRTYHLIEMLRTHPIVRRPQSAIRASL